MEASARGHTAATVPRAPPHKAREGSGDGGAPPQGVLAPCGAAAGTDALLGVKVPLRRGPPRWGRASPALGRPWDGACGPPFLPAPLAAPLSSVNAVTRLCERSLFLAGE